MLVFVRRRIRELNENNTKRYIDERKRQAVQQSRQLESLRKIHCEQLDKLEQEMKRVIYRKNWLAVRFSSAPKLIG